jgi:Flp pilus assembly protein CpaB
VDVQVLLTRKNANSEPALRTILEGAPVLSVNPTPEPNSQGGNLPTVTLLTNPVDADTLALADSGARVRLALRNPLDEATRSRNPMTFDTLLRPAASPLRLCGSAAITKIR